MAKGKKTGGRQKGTPNKGTPEEAKIFLIGILTGEAYRDNLKLRLESGKIHPTIEKMAWERVYGVPKETLELTGQDGGPVITEIRRTIVPKPA